MNNFHKVNKLLKIKVLSTKDNPLPKATLVECLYEKKLSLLAMSMWKHHDYLWHLLPLQVHEA